MSRRKDRSRSRNSASISIVPHDGNEILRRYLASCCLNLKGVTPLLLFALFSVFTRVLRAAIFLLPVRCANDANLDAVLARGVNASK